MQMLVCGPLVIAAARVDLSETKCIKYTSILDLEPRLLWKRMVIFYCLKICVKFSWWNPKAQCDRLWRRLWEVLSSRGKTLTEGISAFIKEITQRFLSLCEDTLINWSSITQKKAFLPETQPCWHSDFTSKNCVWSEFLLFINYPVYDILLEKAEWTENHGSSQSGSFIFTWILCSFTKPAYLILRNQNDFKWPIHLFTKPS